MHDASMQLVYSIILPSAFNSVCAITRESVFIYFVSLADFTVDILSVDREYRKSLTWSSIVFFAFVHSYSLIFHKLSFETSCKYLIDLYDPCKIYLYYLTSEHCSICYRLLILINTDHMYCYI